MKHIKFIIILCILFANYSHCLLAQTIYSIKSERQAFISPEIKEMKVFSNQVLIELEKNDSCIVQIYKYRLIGTEDWRELNFRGVNALINQLLPNSKYEMLITAIYQDNNTSHPLGICFITNE